jgi:MFS family permease
MRAFWLLTSASAVSTVGNTFLYVAIPWALLQSTSSPTLAVLSLGAQNAPYLLAPLLGPLIDRYDRRMLFAIGELTQAAAAAMVPLLLHQGQVGLVFAALFLLGLANVVSDVSGDYGLIPALVPKNRLDKASSRFTSILLVARFVGPALGGLVVAGAGTTWAIELDALTFTLTALTTVVMPRAIGQAARGARVRISRMLREGVAYFRDRPDLRRMTFAVAIYNLGAGALEPTILTVGADRWHWSAGAMGAAVSVGAIAAALGAWLSPWSLSGSNRVRQITLWLTVCVLGSAGLLFGWPLAVLTGFSVLCLGEGGVNAATMVYRQQEIPDELAGRVNTVIRTFITGAIPVSALVLGLTANLDGAAWAFVPATGAAFLALLVWWVRATRRPAPTLVSVRSES